jgi:hypothetical protein
MGPRRASTFATLRGECVPWAPGGLGAGEPPVRASELDPGNRVGRRRRRQADRAPLEPTPPHSVDGGVGCHHFPRRWSPPEVAMAGRLIRIGRGFEHHSSKLASRTRTRGNVYELQLGNCRRPRVRVQLTQVGDAEVHAIPPRGYNSIARRRGGRSGPSPCWRGSTGTHQARPRTGNPAAKSAGCRSSPSSRNHAALA